MTSVLYTDIQSKQWQIISSSPKGVQSLDTVMMNINIQETTIYSNKGVETGTRTCCHAAKTRENNTKKQTTSSAKVG